MKKITVIGAGSFSFSSRIIPDMMYFPELREFELCLMDIDADKLKLIYDFANILKQKNKVQMTISATTSLRESLQDAAYVAATFDIGGMEATAADIAIPAEYGIYQAIGDTLGPAGIFKSLRMAPELIKLVKTISEVAPQAKLINYTNPMSANMRIINDAAPEIASIGFCHGLEHSRAWLGRLLGMNPADIKLHCGGVNHQMWMLAITDQNGKDLYPALRERVRDPQVRALDRVRFELMDLAGYYMTESSYHTSEYLPYFQSEFCYLELSEEEEGNVDPLKETMDTESILAANHQQIPAKRRSMGWGDLQFVNKDQLKGVVETRLPIAFNVDRVNQFSDALFDRFRRAVATGEAAELSLSVEYLARLIHGCETGKEYSIYGSMVNQGKIANLPDEAIVELPVTVKKGAFTGNRVGRLPEFCAGLNRNFINVTLLIAEAVKTGSRHAITQALALDPATNSNRLTIAQLNELSKRMQQANQSYLQYMK